MMKLINYKNIMFFLFFKMNESELMRYYELYQKQLSKLIRVQKIIKF